MGEEERLQAYMASCGVASRRTSEKMILEGRVKVNGQVVNVLGYKVQKNDLVLVDDKPLIKEEFIYIALNKPSGYVSTVSDEFNRKTVLDLITPSDKQKRIYPIGRLDYDTQGIILLTNDGTLTQKLTKPEQHIEKEYLARIKGIIDDKSINKLRKGVVIDGYKTKQAKCELISVDKKNDSSLIKLIITEGKNLQVKKMLDVVGFPVKKLTRVRFGIITADDLGRGEYRKLKIHEVKQLYGL